MVAERWFGVHRGERLTVHIADGVRFISECISAKKYGKSIVGKLSLFYTYHTYASTHTLYSEGIIILLLCKFLHCALSQ